MPLRTSAAAATPAITDKPTAADYQTFERRAGFSAIALTSGRLALSAIWLPAGYSLKSMTFASSSTALATPSHGWAAFYDPSLALLGQTPNDVAITWAATTAKTFTLASAATTTVAGWHYVGVCIVAGTMPTLAGVAPGSALTWIAPSLGGNSTSGLTTTAPTPAATLGAVPSAVYCYVSTT